VLHSSFWYNNWSPYEILGTKVPYVYIHDIHLTIHDIITNDGHHTQTLYTILPSTLAVASNDIWLSFNLSIADAYIWSQNKNGVYSTKSGYSWLLSHHEPDNQTNISCSRIWRLKVPEKFKFLVWLACHNDVPTLALLKHRNIVSSPTCSRCGDHEESLFHCVHDCKFSKVIWQKIGFSSHRFFSSNLMAAWLKEGAYSSRSTLFLAGLWWIWRHRNLM